MNEAVPKSPEELKREAVITITRLRDEVVGLVGICGNGTHPLTETLEALERDEIKPEDIEKVVKEAEKVRDRVCDFR